MKLGYGNLNRLQYPECSELSREGEGRFRTSSQPMTLEYRWRSVRRASGFRSNSIGFTKWPSQPLYLALSVAASVAYFPA